MMDVYLPMHVIAETWFAQPDALKVSDANHVLISVFATVHLPRDLWEQLSRKSDQRIFLESQGKEIVNTAGFCPHGSMGQPQPSLHTTKTL